LPKVVRRTVGQVYDTGLQERVGRTDGDDPSSGSTLMELAL
jgi:hypothetical protein